jgi:drug/metabolite transporter (DMT)-like permease
VRDTQVEPKGRLAADLGALAVCSLIWGTTWRAIKLQLGVVPPLDSVVYRFALASILLFGWCLLTRRSLVLTRRQHLQVLAQGASNFALQYPLVYLAEETVSSGAMAVIFASIPFVNLVVFRLFDRRHASPLAWLATLLGLAGVAAMSLSQSGEGATSGVALALVGVGMSVVGNLFAARAQASGVATAPGTAWAMGYGAALLAGFQLLTGAAWKFDASLSYAGALVYLSVFGSVIAFVAYYGLARRRGYTFASYVAALTPPTAMAISSVTEHTRWGPEAAAGLALVLAGQLLLIRASRT